MDLLAYADRIESDLRRNILPFWMEKVRDGSRKSFHGELGNALVVDPTAARGALLSSRLLWTFATACRIHRDPAYREMADYAFDALLRRFADLQDGGFLWSVNADGPRPERTSRSADRPLRSTHWPPTMKQPATRTPSRARLRPFGSSKTARATRHTAGTSRPFRGTGNRGPTRSPTATTSRHAGCSPKPPRCSAKPPS